MSVLIGLITLVLSPNLSDASETLTQADCPSEFRHSLRSLVEEPSPSLPAVVHAGSRPKAPALNTELYASVLKDYLLHGNQDAIFPIPNLSNEGLLEKFISKLGHRMAIKLEGGTLLEKLNWLSSHPEIHGFAPKNELVRDEIYTSFFNAWKSTDQGPRLFSKGTPRTFTIPLELWSDPKKASVLRQTFDDNFRQYLEVWKDYLARRERPVQAAGPAFRLREFLWDKNVPINLCALAGGAMALSSACILSVAHFDALPQPLAITAFPALGFGGWLGLKLSKRFYHSQFMRSVLSSADGSAVRESYQNLVRASRGRARLKEHQSKLESAWERWSESLPESRKSLESSSSLDPSYQRIQALDTVTEVNSELVRTSELLNSLIQAPLPNGRKVAASSRLDDIPLSLLSEDIQAATDRQRFMLSEIRGRMEETASLIERTLGEVSRGLATESSSKTREQMGLAIQLLKVQLEQVHQHIVTTTRESHLKDHLNQLFDLVRQEQESTP